MSNHLQPFNNLLPSDRGVASSFCMWGLFCPVPYMEDRGGGCVVGGATSTLRKSHFINLSVGVRSIKDAEAETFEFLLQPRERHYINV